MASRGTWTWYGLPTIDLGVTETLSNIFGGKGSTTATLWYNPAAIGTNSGQNQTYIQAGTQSKINPVDLNSINKKNIPGGETLGLSTIGSTGLETLAQDERNDQAKSIDTGYGYNEALYNQQLGDAESSYNRSVAESNDLYSGINSQVNQQRDSAASLRDKSIDEAGQTARNTQKSVRNSLRALGLLNSSAGGDMLTRPINEFDKVRANYVENYNNTMSQLDDFVRQKTAEHATYLNSIREQYQGTVNRIKTDLRFNEQERNNALQALNTALASKVADIRLKQQEAINYARAVGAQALQETNSLTGAYNSGVSSIIPSMNNQYSSNASIYEDPRKKLSSI